MSEVLKDPNNIPLGIYAFVVVLAAAGGAVRYLNDETKLKSFSVARLSIDMITSAFAGLMTYWVTVYMNLNPTMGSMLVAIGGYLGVNAIREFEKIFLTIIRKGAK